MVNMGDGVTYACPDGLFYVGQSGTKLITDKLFTREEWQDLTPLATVAEQYDEKYVIFFENSDIGMVFDPELSGPTTLQYSVVAVWVDPETDLMYFAIYDAATNQTNIKKFNSGGSRLVYTWRSKVFKLPTKMKFTAARRYATFDAALTQAEIDAINAERAYLSGLNADKIAAGEVNGAINATAINTLPVNGDELYLLPDIPQSAEYILKVYGNGNLIHNVTVSNNLPLRLPSITRYDEYEVELSGIYPIQTVTLATSIRELMDNGP